MSGLQKPEIAKTEARVDLRRDNIIRRPEVLRRTGLKRSTLYNKIAAGTFPRQIQLSLNCVGWYESQVNDWVANPR